MNFTWNNGYKWKLSNDTKERLFVRLIDFIHFLQFWIIIRHINTSVRLSAGSFCLYVCLSVCWNLLSVCMSHCLLEPSVCLYVCLLEPFVCMSVGTFCLCPSLCLLEPSVCMYVCLYLSECLSNSERIMCQHHLNNTFIVEYNTILWRIPVDFN